MSTVREHLDASHRAHLRYHDALPRQTAMPGGPLIVAGGHAGLARLSLEEAQRERAAALALDPDRIDQAWRDEAAQFPHDELMAFYQEQLTRE